MTCEYRSPTGEDIAFIAAHLRDEDVLEVAASHGHSPLQALVESVRESTQSFVAVVDGVPVCIFGFVYEPKNGRASVWLLGTDDVDRYRKTFMAETSRILDEWAAWFGSLYNYVSKDSVRTLAWLTRVGFKQDGEAVPYGPLGEPFYRMVKNDV